MPTQWEKEYKGDDPEWEAYLERARTGKLMGHELHRLGREKDPATGRKMTRETAQRSDWPLVKKEARRRGYWKTLRKMYDIEASAPLPPLQLPDFGAQPSILPGPTPFQLPEGVLQILENLGVQPPAIFAQPPSPTLPPPTMPEGLFPTQKPTTPQLPFGGEVPQAIRTALGMMGKTWPSPTFTPKPEGFELPTQEQIGGVPPPEIFAPWMAPATPPIEPSPTDAPYTPMPGGWPEFMGSLGPPSRLEGTPYQIPQGAYPGIPPPPTGPIPPGFGGWRKVDLLPTPKAEPPIKPEAVWEGFVETARRGKRWVSETIPGVSLAERGIGLARRGTNWWIDKAMRMFGLSSEWAEMAMGQLERAAPAPTEEETIAQLERGISEGWYGREVAPLSPEIASAVAKPARDRDEFKAWLGSIEPHLAHRINWETSRVHWSGYERNLLAGQELYARFKEAEETGVPVTDEEVTEILETHQDFLLETLGRVIVDPLLIDMFVGAPIGRALFGVTTAPLKIPRMAGATAGWTEKALAGSKFGRYMVTHHPVLSEALVNTVKFVPRKMRGGLDWMRQELAISVARKVGLDTKDVAASLVTGRTDDSIRAAKEALEAMPGDEFAVKFRQAIETGQTGSPIHDDILMRTTEKLGGPGAWDDVMKRAFRGVPLSEYNGAEVAGLLDQAAVRHTMNLMGVPLEADPFRRGVGWLRRLWVEQILFSRPAWAFINAVTNVTYGMFSGYDMFGNLDDMIVPALGRRGGITPMRIGETSLITEEMVEKALGASKLATAEIPGIGKPASWWSRTWAKVWTSNEQAARLRIWAQASDAKWASEFAQIVPNIPVDLDPVAGERLLNIWAHTDSPQAFQAAMNLELEAMRAGMPRLNLVHYPNPLPGGFPIPSVKSQLISELDELGEAGRYTESALDDAFWKARTTIDDEFAKRAADVSSRAGPDARYLDEALTEWDYWLPAWDEFAPEEQDAFRKMVWDRAKMRRNNWGTFDWQRLSLQKAAGDKSGIVDDIASLGFNTEAKRAKFYTEARKEADRLLASYQKGLLSFPEYRSRTEVLWQGFTENITGLYADATGQLAGVAKPLGRPPTVRVDYMGQAIGPGQDMTSTIARAFNKRFPGRIGRVTGQTDWHWIVQIEGELDYGTRLLVPKGKMSATELADMISKYVPAEMTVDEMMRGMSGVNWEQQLFSLRNQRDVAKAELAKWQEYALAQIQMPIEPAQMAAEQVAILETWRDIQGEQLAGAALAADTFGQKEAARVLFDYLTTTNFDNVMRHIFPFWKWPSQNLPFLASLMIKKPWIGSMLGQYRNISDYYVDNYNATERMRGYIPIPGSKEVFGTTIWMNPIQVPLSSLNQMFRPERSYEQDDPFGARMLDFMGRLGFTPGPHITGTRVGREFIPGAAQLGAKGLELAGVEGAELEAPRAEDVFQIVPHISLLGYPAEEMLDMDVGWEPPWHPYLVRRKITEWETEGRISPTTNKPITHAESLAAQYDPASELYQLANADVRQQLWLQGAAGFFLGYYPKMMSPGEEEIRADVGKYGEIPPQREDLRRIFLDNHSHLRTYWNAFGPDDDVKQRYATIWIEEGRNYPGSNKLLTERDVTRALQNLDDPLRMALEQQIVRDMGDRERRLGELREPLEADLTEITPANTKAYEDRIQQYYDDRDAINAEYPLLDDEWGTPGFLEKPVTWLVNQYNKLGDGLFGDSGEALTEDAPRIYSQRAQAFRSWLEMTAPMFGQVFGYNLVDEFDIRRARYEDVTQAAYNAFERLYLRPGASYMFGEDISQEQRDMVEALINEAQGDKAAILAEVARVHPDWSSEELAKVAEVPLPDFDTWMRRNDTLKEALISKVWEGWMAESEAGNRLIVPKQALAQIEEELGLNIRQSFETNFLNKETRDYDSITIRDLTLVAQILDRALPPEEGFDITGVEGLPEDLEDIRKIEPLSGAQAQDYANYKQQIGYVMDWAEKDPEAAWGWVEEHPDVQALFDRWGGGRKPTAKSTWWDLWWSDIPPGSVTKELRDIPIVDMVLEKGVREHLKDSAYRDAEKEAQRWLAEHPEVANLGSPEEYQIVRELVGWIYDTAAEAGPEGSTEYKRTVGQAWDTVRAHPEYGPIIDKYYPPRTSGRPPGKASPPAPEQRQTRGTIMPEVMFAGPGSEYERMREHLGAEGFEYPPDHPATVPVHDPALKEQMARQEPSWPGDNLNPEETEQFRGWAFKEAGFTPGAQEELAKYELNVKRSVGAGGGWDEARRVIELGAPQLEVAIHECAHAYWGTQRDERKDALIEAVMRLAEEADPQYELAAHLADIYINGDPQTGFKGMKLSESVLSPSVWGYGPEDVWNDEEMFAGLASGVMGHLEELPPYIRTFYEGLFTGETGEYATTDKTVPYADFWPAMAIKGSSMGTTEADRGGGRLLRTWEEFRQVAGPEIVEDLENRWNPQVGASAVSLSVAATDYLYSLYQRYPSGQASFTDWLTYLRALREK